MANFDFVTYTQAFIVALTSCSLLYFQAEEFFSANRTTEQILAESGTLTAQLVAATETNDRSLLPADLNTTNNILTTVITALENSSSNTSAPSNDVLECNLSLFVYFGVQVHDALPSVLSSGFVLLGHN